MDMDLLDILVCPRTKKKLIIAPEEIINKVNEKIKKGDCKDISGEPVSKIVTTGLYQAEDKTFYMIRDGIPLLIYDNGIQLN